MNIDTHAIEFPMKTFNLENKTNIVTETRVLNNLINVKTDQINKLSDMYTLYIDKCASEWTEIPIGKSNEFQRKRTTNQINDCTNSWNVWRAELKLKHIKTKYPIYLNVDHRVI